MGVAAAPAAAAAAVAGSAGAPEAGAPGATGVHPEDVAPGGAPSFIRKVLGPPAGAEASARLYSLIETAKANRCEPYAYLCHVFTELPKAKTLAEIEALLPWNFARPATLSIAA